MNGQWSLRWHEMNEWIHRGNSNTESESEMNSLGANIAYARAYRYKITHKEKKIMELTFIRCRNTDDDVSYISVDRQIIVIPLSSNAPGRGVTKQWRFVNASTTYIAMLTVWLNLSFSPIDVRCASWAHLSAHPRVTCHTFPYLLVKRLRFCGDWFVCVSDNGVSWSEKRAAGAAWTLEVTRAS